MKLIALLLTILNLGCVKVQSPTDEAWAIFKQKLDEFLAPYINAKAEFVKSELGQDYILTYSQILNREALNYEVYEQQVLLVLDENKEFIERYQIGYENGKFVVTEVSK